MFKKEYYFCIVVVENAICLGQINFWDSVENVNRASFSELIDS